MIKFRFIFILFWFLAHKAVGQIDQQKVDVFVANYAKNNGVLPAEVQSILERAVYQPAIIERIQRPSEDISWKRYRGIFMTDERVAKGVTFWDNNLGTLQLVSDDTGVEVEYLVALLGVETYYGERKGGYKVLDALFTLAFGYPKRATFFTKELGEYLTLAKEQRLDVFEMEGSYAGAIGYCQFMPCSYRAYAKGFANVASCDLVNNVDDAISSAANYLKVHKWRHGEVVVMGTNKKDHATVLAVQSLKPSYSVDHYLQLGYVAEDLNQKGLVTLIELDNEVSKEYWFGFNNFYVITRYNHSALYAMAEHQLAQEIKKARG